LSKELDLLQKLEILKLHFEEEKAVKDIAPLFDISEGSVYGYIRNKELLEKYVENLDGFVMKYLTLNCKSNSAYMKMLLENIMHKSAVQKVEMSGSVELTGDAIREALEKSKEQPK